MIYSRYLADSESGYLAITSEKVAITDISSATAFTYDYGNSYIKY